MAGLHITDIESAINWWRARAPGDGVTLSPELHALAEVYALMVFHRESTCDEDSMPAAAQAAWLAWYDTTPDAPCIAICSTSQGDELCKGCGRTFDEVQNWPVLSPGEKRATWRRITLEGTAWRFNRYAERAIERLSGANTAPIAAAPSVVPASPAPAPTPLPTPAAAPTPPSASASEPASPSAPAAAPAIAPTAAPAAASAPARSSASTAAHAPKSSAKKLQRRGKRGRKGST